MFAHEQPADSIEAARQQSRTEYCWYLSGQNDYTDFRFDMVPPHWEHDHVYTWPSQWQQDGQVYLTPKHNPGPLHYMKDQSVTRLPCFDNWQIPQNIDTDAFDFSWHPNPIETFIHVFGTQHQPDGGPVYKTPGANEIKYEASQRGVALPTTQNWHIPNNIVESDFDYSWHPRSSDKYIHVFGTQWQPDGGPEYHTPDANERKYESTQKAVAIPQLENWYVPDYIDLDNFDFSWHPRLDDNFTHVFGTQWHNSGGPEYRTPGATEDKFESVQRATSLPQPDRWRVPDGVETDNFDFSWHPARGENYVHVFGSQWARQGGPEYVSSPEAQIKYENAQTVKGKITCDVFVVDQFNKNNNKSFDTVLAQDENARKIRGVGNWASIIKKACENSTSDFVWIVSSDYDYTDFDFGWYPETWQSNMIHVFGSKFQKWANVFRVPRWEFLRLAPWFEDVKDFPELNFVEDQTVELFDDNREIVYVDFGNAIDFPPDLDHKTTRFFSTWLETLGRICERTDSEYIWVASSICDYTNFDFGWEPEPWQQDMLHVFASNDQREGDTFLVPVQRFKQQQPRLELLGWFDTVNYVEDISVPAYSWPTVSNVNDINTLYAWIVYAGHSPVDYTPSNWKKPNLHVFSESGTVSLCPRDCKTHFQDQLYDYPYILRHKQNNLIEKPHDIVFISYDEKNADINYEILLKQQPRTKRLHGVEGMENALYQAALLSETDWYYAVFAKTRLHEDFDFEYRPDRLQGEKHYIFDCKNMVNGLVYGHMGMVMYHKQMVIDSHDYEVLKGLDYTMSHRHDVVPILSCYGEFNTSPFETWRSAFRECIKLAQAMDLQPTIETKYRLDVWCNHAEGDFAEYCTTGAKHGVEFYNANKDDMTELKKSFRWDWLQDYFNSKFT